MGVAFLEQIQACDPERLIFIDESGSHVAMTRTRTVEFGPYPQKFLSPSTELMRAVQGDF